MSIGKVRASGKQIASARQYVGLTQRQLAEIAGVAKHTVTAFEKEATLPHETTRERIQSVLEARGIVFTNGSKPGFYFDSEKAIIPSA